MSLLELHRDGETYDLGNSKRRLVMGGDIYNPLPFDGGPRAKGTFVFADGMQQGNWTWLGKGEQGYAVNEIRGIVRVFPVRGDQTKYIQISGLADKACEVNQIDDQNLEIFADKPNTRWSLKMGPQGFKPEIILKPGWSGTPKWQFRFELNGGLTLEGAWIMDGATPVLKMHNPFSIDAEGTHRAVTESLVDGIVTLTADLSGLTYPILIDPTLGPISASRDCWLFLFEPTTGNGQDNFWHMSRQAGALGHPLHYYDISAIPPGSTVTSTSWDLKSQAVFGAYQQAYTCSRMTIDDWEDGSGANVEANYNNYKDPNVAWPGGAGGAGDIDATVTGSSDGSELALGTFSIIILDAIAQDAIDNRSGIMNWYMQYDTEGGAPDVRIKVYSKENLTPGNPPELTVNYTEATEAGGLMGGGLAGQSTLMGGGIDTW